MERILDRYEVLSRLGRGGTADILRVKDRAFSGRVVALKRCHTSAQVAQLGREFLSLRAVQHPNLPAVFDFHGDLGDGRAAYTLEEVDGQTAEVAVPAGELSHLVEVMTGVLRALAHVHARGVIHGDLHPHNILVAAHPDGRKTVKVLDLTPTDARGSGLGALPYLAPERLEGGQPSAASDLFSVGVTLHRLMTGELPFPDYPHVGDDEIPTGVERLGPLKPLVVSLLSRRPELRPQSAAEVLRTLAGLTHLSAQQFPQDVVQATLRDGPTIPIGHWPGRWVDDVAKAVATGGAGGVFALVGGGGSGRSRTLDELRWHIQATPGARILAARASATPSEGEVVRDLLLQIPETSRHSLPEHLGEVVEALVIGEPLPGHDHPDTEKTRRRHVDQLAQAVSQVAGHHGLVVAVDDVDQIDQLSLSTITAIARTVTHLSAGGGRLALVVSGLPGGTVDSVLSDAGSVGQVASPPALDKPAVRALIQSTFSGLEPSHRLLNALHERTGGNPLVLQETIATAYRSGWLDVQSAVVDLSASAPSPLQVPSTVEQAWALRLSALSDSALRALALLRFCEVAVPVDLMATALGVSDEVFGRGLAELLRFQVVRVLGHGAQAMVSMASPTLTDHVESMGLVVDAGELERLAGARSSGVRARVLTTLATLERPAPDGRARAEALLEELLERNAVSDALLLCARLPAPPAGPYGEALARSGRDKDALRAWRALPEHEADERTGRLDLRRGRHREGLERLSRVLPAATGTNHAQLSLICARAHLMLGEYDEAASLCAASADHMPAWLEPQRQWLLGLVAFYRGDYDAARVAYDVARDAFERIGNKVEEANVVNAIGLIHYRRSELEPAFEAFNRSLELGEAAGDRERVLLTLMNVAVIHQVRGSWRLAESRYIEALRMARVTGNQSGTMKVLQNLGNLRRYLGRLEAAEEALTESLALAESGGNHYIANHNRGLLGEVAWLGGHFERARELLTAARAAFEAAGNVGEAADCGRSLAEVLIELGVLEEAAAVARDALDAGERLGQTRLAALAAASLSSTEYLAADYDSALATAQRGRSHLGDDERPEVTWQAAFAVFRAARALGQVDSAMAAAQTVVRTLDEAAGQVSESQRSAFLAVRNRTAALAETRWLTDPALQSGGARPRGDSLTRLLEVNQRLTTELDLDRLLEYIIDSAILLTGAERGFLLMLDDDASGDDDLRVMVARNIDQENIRNKKYKVSYSIAQQVVATGDAVLTTDAMGDERYTQYLSIHHLKLRSVLCLPMMRGGRVLGALYVDNRFQRNAFTADDLSFMEAFANQAAIAWFNAKIMGDKARALERLAASQAKVQELNDKLKQQLEVKTRALEETEKLLVVQRRQLTRNHGYESIVGDSEPLQRLFNVLDRVRDNDISVLVTGESGTGKELVARAIHFNGRRKERPFVAINCSSIPESLIESELFGHVRGSFTGATGDKKGMFEVANRGTLFLDEIGEMPIEMQAKLLRALQEGEIQKVGGTRPIKVDVRIVAATNRNLREMIKAKTFREDLYYRLAVVTIELPALRQRVEDIPLLVQHFLEQNTKDKLSPVSAISAAALRLLMRYRWPGNVRELQTVIKNASIFAGSDTLQPQDFNNFPNIIGGTSDTPSAAPTAKTIRPLAELEREAIIHALESNGGNKKRTAEMLGIDRRTLYNKLATYGVSVERRAHVSGSDS